MFWIVPLSGFRCLWYSQYRELLNGTRRLVKLSGTFYSTNEIIVIINSLNVLLLGSNVSVEVLGHRPLRWPKRFTRY